MQVPKEGLTQKLQRLSASQQSIESVSSFCIFYNKDARGVVQIWDQEFYKAPPDRRLALLFLANHILQEGRKKSMGFQEEFFKVLPKALAYVIKHGDDKTKRQAARLVAVWEERRVFGSKHIKSFRDVVGGSSSGGSGERGSKAAAGGDAGAAGASGAAAAAAAAADLGPVGEALVKVSTCGAAAAARSKEFNSSWSQGTLSTAGLPELTTAHTQLNAYSSALQEELAARQAAVTALTAEVARQNAEISRLQSQLQSAGGQRQQLEQQMATLTQQMASAMASLGQFMPQQNGGGAAATPPAVGSPQAPELLLEDEDDAGEGAAMPVLPAAPAAAASVGSAASAAPPGVNGGPLGGFMQQQPQEQQQQQPAAAPSGLAALLSNPAMLSAAILGGAAAAAPSSAPAGDMLTGGTAHGMQLQLNPALGSGLDDGSMFGGFGQMPGTFSAGFGVGGDQQAGFADEGDDPYDPTLEG